MNGLFDPSIEDDGHGVLWMAYSVVDVPKHVHTHVAKSVDAGRTWEFVAAVNVSADDTIHPPTGEPIEGVWRHEVPALVRDPTDPAKPWKLFWHKYFTAAPYKDRMFQRGWIAMREAASPAGPWSPEIAMFGAGGFLLPPHKTQIDLTQLHPDLKDCKVFTEPGALVDDGVLYLSLQAYARGLFWSQWKVILLASSDHGKTWKYCATLLNPAQAKPYGGDFFTGTSLAHEDGRLFLLVAPETQGQSKFSHHGTVIFEFDDIATGKLKLDAQGAPAPVKFIRPSLSSGGQSTYNERNACGGMIMPQFDLGNLPRPWRIYNTHVKLIDPSSKSATDDSGHRPTSQLPRR